MTQTEPAAQARLAKVVGALALTAVYWLPVRRWFSRWGTTPEELARVMPGDALAPDATEMSMQTVTVNAPPEAIWPWLVQIGYQRGGLYSYDWLDRLFGFLDRPSATRILPEFQHLAVGDKVPWGRTGTELTVGVLEPLRALALSYEDRGFKWVWQFGLYPLGDQRTRFVTRGSERVPNTLLWWLGMRIMEPASFIMTRRFLLGVKERAEALRTETGPGDELLPGALNRIGATRPGTWAIGHVVSPVQRRLLLATGGRVSLTGKRPVLLLTTTGRRSRRPRTIPLFFLRDGDDLVVCNVRPPFERPNPWPLNVRANPNVSVRIGGVTEQRVARGARPEEVEKYWPALVEMWPAYERFFADSHERAIFVLQRGSLGA